MSERPNLRDPIELVRSLESPLRLRLVGILLEMPEQALPLRDLVLRSSRHEQDVKACLRPMVQDQVLDVVDDGTAFRFHPELPRGVIDALRAGVDARADLLGRERHVRERVLAGMIGVDPKMQLIFEMIRQVCRLDVPVLITGETGTGKDMVARAIHDLGGRRQQYFGAVNCATLTEQLFESQVFGHARGAFTGAVREHVGLVERCDGGTLFLDEIGELSIASQVKLLRVLQDRTFNRVGETTTRRSQFRLIAATNRDLPAMIVAKTFREDLYYRLNVFSIRIPSLRERKEDVPYLAVELLKSNAEKVGAQGADCRIAPDAMRLLTEYDWPGNVRELENVVVRAAIMAGSGDIRAEHIPALIPTRPSEQEPSEGQVSREQRPLRTLAEVESEYIAYVVQSLDGNMVAAAKTLGISRTTLYKKLKDAGVSS